MDSLDSQGVLISDINHAPAGPDGSGPDQHSFNNGVRIRFDDAAIHKGARVPFVAVTNHVLRLSLRAPNGLPLRRGREPRASPASQSGDLDFIKDLLRGHLGKRLG